jgi:hypothetical protein
MIIWGVSIRVVIIVIGQTDALFLVTIPCLLVGCREGANIALCFAPCSGSEVFGLQTQYRHCTNFPSKDPMGSSRMTAYDNL